MKSTWRCSFTRQIGQKTITVVLESWVSYAPVADLHIELGPERSSSLILSRQGSLAEILSEYNRLRDEPEALSLLLLEHLL